MKKFTILFVAVVAMFVSSANAQNKDDIFVGGTLGFGIYSSGSNGYMGTTGSFNVTPEVGFFVTDNIKVGAGIGYSVSGGNHSLLLMPNIAYYLPIVDKFYYTPQFNIGGGFRTGGVANSTNGIFSMSLNLVALEYQPVENMAVSMSLINLDYSYRQKTNYVDFGFLTSPSVGFRYYF